MRDYSFIRLKDNFADAKDIGDRKITEEFFFDFISLKTNEPYFQISNVTNGISFEGNYKVEIVNCNDAVLKDVTAHVFIEEITGVNGNTQIKFEVINIGEDFYRETVYFKFSSTISDEVYYSNPLNITDYQDNETTLFKYKCYNDIYGIPYTNAQDFQQIRLKTYFDIPIDDSEIEGYYQTSRNRNISARVLNKQFEQYQIDYITRFGYDRLNVLLKSDFYYIDEVRITDTTKVDSNDMIELSNVFTTNFIVSKNYNDTASYEYQIFDGFNLVTKSPFGTFTLASLPTDIEGTFNYPITLNEGTVQVYDASDNSLLATYTESDITVIGNTFTIDNTGLITSNGNYYIKVSSGLFSYIGVDFEGINNTTDWAFIVQDGDYSILDYSDSDYLTTT